LDIENLKENLYKIQKPPISGGFFMEHIVHLQKLKLLHMLQIHSYWAYLVLVMIIVAFANAITGLLSKRTFESKDLRLPLFALIVSHIQLIIGLGWYFMSPWFKGLKENGMGETMGDATARMMTVEHPLMMILAIVCITIGFSKHKKKSTDTAKFKTITIFYGIALLLILARIPWGQWFD